MKQYIFFSFLLILGVLSCVEAVDFDASEPNDLLVVDGSISDGGTTHYLRLSRTGALETRTFDPVRSARVTLFEEGGTPLQYTEEADGHYRLDAPGLSGRTYHIEIELEDGNTYRSRPEKIPVRVDLDSATYELAYEELVNDAGNIIRRHFVKAVANMTIPDMEVGPFIRWEVEDVYLVSEKKCSPLDNALNCYIRTKDVLPNVSLFSGTNFTAGLPYRQEVKKQRIDNSFGERYSFSIYQVAHTRAALDYWSKISQVVSLEGSIFDVAPAPIPGNVYNVDDPDEQVLGYFSGVAIDTAHLFVNRFDVAPLVTVSPYCGPPELPWWQFPPECCNCIDLANSSYERPDFW